MLQVLCQIHGSLSFDGTANLYFTNEIQDTVGSLISGSGSTNMSLSYDDTNGQLTISSSGKTQEEIEDIVGAMFTSNTEMVLLQHTMTMMVL